MPEGNFAVTQRETHIEVIRMLASVVAMAMARMELHHSGNHTPFKETIALCYQSLEIAEEALR